MALLLFCTVTFFGCGSKQVPTLYIYCNETFWYVIQEEAIAFNMIHGFRIILIPIRAPQTSDEAEDSAEDSIEINGDHRPSELREWQSRPGRPDIQTDPPTDTQVVVPQTQIHPEIEQQIQSIFTDSFGDMFLSDSLRHLEKLRQTALSVGEFPICYLTLAMLVPQGNPHQFRSVKDVLESNRRLGIVDPSRDGLGESSWTMLGRIVTGGESAIPMKLVQLYERQYDLLEALEQGKIDAALVWDATSQLSFLLVKYADEYNEDSRFEPYLREAMRRRNWTALRNVLGTISEVLVEEKGFTEKVPLTENPDEHFVIAVRLVALSSTSNIGHSKRFADFMRSNQAKEILRRFGFVSE